MGTRTAALDETHDAGARSWWASANAAGADFPLQNLPFAVFRRRGSAEAPRVGVGLGDDLIDVAALQPVLTGDAATAAHAAASPALNPLMALGHGAAQALRLALFRLYRDDAPAPARADAEAALRPLAGVELLRPVQIGGYTDFFASVHHASNAGRLFRPDAPLLPNYKHLPVAYNGRANSVEVADTVRRPRGQVKRAGEDLPTYRPSERLDHEVEVGIYIGTPTRRGEPVPVGEAWRHVFGVSLLNDWSARDIQAWEYQPLGPFLGKSFATGVAPWVVTAQALAPFRTEAWRRPAGDPAPLPHLADALDQAQGAIGLQVEAWLATPAMRTAGRAPQRLSRSNAADLYWTIAQMLAHHSSNGCALDTGDLLGTGTISGDGPEAMGSLLEITRNGQAPIAVGDGERRSFLEDGDELVLRGRCEREGFVGIGFGECRGVVLPA